MADVEKHYLEDASFAVTATASPPKRNHIGAVCFDAGGVRAIAAAIVIQTIMKKLGIASKMKSIEIRDHFHMLSGAHTGGFLAILLGRLRVPINDVIKFYEDVPGMLLDVPDNMMGVLKRFSQRPGQVFEAAAVKFVGSGSSTPPPDKAVFGSESIERTASPEPDAIEKPGENTLKEMAAADVGPGETSNLSEVTSAQMIEQLGKDLDNKATLKVRRAQSIRRLSSRVGKVFKPKPKDLDLVGSSAKANEAATRTPLGEQAENEVDVLLYDEREDRLPVCVTAAPIRKDSPTSQNRKLGIFRSYDAGDKTTTIVEAARASCAASKQNDSGSGLNSPARLLLDEAIDYYGYGVRFSPLLSIGTGVKEGVLGGLSDASKTHDEISRMFDSKSMGTYVRINIPGLHDVAMDDYKAIDKIISITHRHLESDKGEELINKVVEALQTAMDDEIHPLVHVTQASANQTTSPSPSTAKQGPLEPFGITEELADTA